MYMTPRMSDVTYIETLKTTIRSFRFNGCSWRQVEKLISAFCFLNSIPRGFVAEAIREVKEEEGIKQ